MSRPDRTHGHRDTSHNIWTSRHPVTDDSLRESDREKVSSTTDTWSHPLWGRYGRVKNIRVSPTFVPDLPSTPSHVTNTEKGTRRRDILETEAVRSPCLPIRLLLRSEVQPRTGEGWGVSTLVAVTKTSYTARNEEVWTLFRHEKTEKNGDTGPTLVTVHTFVDTRRPRPWHIRSFSCPFTGLLTDDVREASGN